MNILVVCHYGLYQDYTASFVHNQAKTYVALGNRVRVLIPIAFGKPNGNGKRVQTGIYQETADGVELYYLRYLSLSRYGERDFNTRSAIFALRPHLASLLKNFTPDVIHAHTLGFDSGIGAWLKQRLGVPLIVTTHGSDTSIPVARGRTVELISACDKADRVVAVSSALANKLCTCGTKTQVSVILNGFQLNNLPQVTAKEPLAFVQTSHLIKQKRTDVTIRAFAGIQKRHPEATMTLIGDGPERGTLEALCRELNVDGAIRFTGQLPNKEALAEMIRARFFVMPSVSEGFGIVYLEAMACGCITIGTQGEGIADLIENGKNGFLVPPDNPEAIADVVETCLKDLARAAEIAERGRKDALTLTWEANAKKYVDLFGRLVK